MRRIRRPGPFGLLGSLAVAGLVLGLTRAGNAPAEPVHPLLPWHEVKLDGRGRLLPWGDATTAYDRVLHSGWRFIERRVPIDRRSGLRTYLAYPIFDPRTGQGVGWQHDPAFLDATFVESLVPWYAYAGDGRAVTVVRSMLERSLHHGTTPAGWAWSSVPFTTSCPGAPAYGGCFRGLARTARRGIEPDKVGLLGLAYARFWELTGERRYLEAAVRCADALARHVRPGDQSRTPWPFRLDARSGATIGGARFGGAVIAPVMLFDELIRIRAGTVPAFRRARSLALRWLSRQQLDPSSPSYDRWTGFYEDVGYDHRNLNQAAPMLTAAYLLAHPVPGMSAATRVARARHLVDWVAKIFGRGPFHGALAINEQRQLNRAGCCSAAGLGSDTARWALVAATLAARTGNHRLADGARRSLAYATYFVRSDGLTTCCGVGPRFRHPYWFSDGYGDLLGTFSHSLAQYPDLAPPREDHVLGSSSVVQQVSYANGDVAYRTFDRHAVDLLRLRAVPRAVVVGGRRLPRVTTLRQGSYTVTSLTDGDVVLRVDHTRRRVTVRIGDG